MKFIKIFLTLLILLTHSTLFSAESGAGSRILVKTLPNRPVAGSTWTLTLLIDYSEPNEVNVLAPHFDSAIFLEQVIKTPCLIDPDTVGAGAESLERWTSMEYHFILSSSGTVNFDAFTVITPRGQSTTAPFELNIQRPPNTAVVQNYRFAWEGAPSELKTGERAVFSLRYSGANYANSPPQAGQFLPPAIILPTVPPGYILESIPLTSDETSAGIALKLRLIPLEAAPFALARRQFSHNGAIFEVPALRIPVKQAEHNSGAQNKLAAAENIPAPPFPPIHPAIQNHLQLYKKYQGECDEIYDAVKMIWEEGRRADAIASLRQSERDHPAGAFFAAIRREADKALGLARTNDEKRSRFKGKSREAVLRETSVRRIPDMAGEEIDRFKEGQPVLLNGKTPHREWMQVTANDDTGTSGWVLEEMIIFY